MPEQKDEPEKSSSGWRTVFTTSVAALIILVSQKLSGAFWKDYQSSAQWLSPVLAQLFGLPVQHAVDALDKHRAEESIKKLSAELQDPATTPKRKKVIQANTEFYQKRIFEIESKSFFR